MGAKGFTERDYDEMERMFANGLLTEEIAHWFGCTRQWVHAKLRQRGIDTRSQLKARMADREHRLRYRVCELCGATFDRKAQPYHRIKHRSNPDGLDVPIAEAYRSGDRVPDIEARFGVNAPRVYRAANRAGVPLRRAINRAPTMAETRDRQAKMLEMRTTGLTYGEIARQLRVSRSLVSQICGKAGL